MSGKESVEVTVELRRDDPKKEAIAVYDGKDDDDGKEIWVWLPRSQIDVTPKAGKVIIVTMPEWLANKKGLI